MKKIYLTIICYLMASCYMDFKEEIAIIKNNSSKSFLLVDRTDSIMNDSIFNNLYYLNDTLLTNQSVSITWPNIRAKSAPNSVKDYIFIYDLNKMDSLRKIGQTKEIYNKALLKQITIQLNQIKYPIDTIFLE